MEEEEETTMLWLFSREVLCVSASLRQSSASKDASADGGSPKADSLG
jgi:hypothetical protein